HVCVQNLVVAERRLLGLIEKREPPADGKRYPGWKLAAAPAGSRAAIVFIHIGTPPSMNLPDIISISLPILHRPCRR
ncbi:hypothetical protein SB724_20180, partial [Bacillus sp. SIMBA_031]|uniref:hypothetical protein n=1 Tax=Bacillus sp. SIMBA_031 TaxID=3085774 RepID=UPI0039784349